MRHGGSKEHNAVNVKTALRHSVVVVACEGTVGTFEDIRFDIAAMTELKGHYCDRK